MGFDYLVFHLHFPAAAVSGGRGISLSLGVFALAFVQAVRLGAGFDEAWYPVRNQPELTFTIITCPPNRVIASIHDRMPVILDEGAAEDWMKPREPQRSSLKRLLIPAPDDILLMTPASSLANSVKNDGPELLIPDNGEFRLT